MELDLVRLLSELEYQVDNYQGGADGHAMFLEGKADVIRDIIKLGFKVAK